MFQLTNKTAIVTGGGSGIGKAVCLLFGKSGAHVFVADLNKEAAEITATEIVQQGGRAQALPVNVANQEEVLRAYAHAGTVDILVNSAGVSHVGNVETTTTNDFDKVFNVNVKGVYNSLFAAIPLMKKNGGGVILNMASIASSVGIPDRFAYSMSKGAVLAMTLSTAKDYINHNIRCNCISPARVHTPFVDGFLSKNYPGKEAEMFAQLSKTQPIGRMAEPHEIAVLILYLCSDEASYITGADYPIDGGFIRLNN